jgi:hypothetical protein
VIVEALTNLSHSVTFGEPLIADKPTKTMESVLRIHPDISQLFGTEMSYISKQLVHSLSKELEVESFL